MAEFDFHKELDLPDGAHLELNAVLTMDDADLETARAEAFVPGAPLNVHVALKPPLLFWLTSKDNADELGPEEWGILMSLPDVCDIIQNEILKTLGISTENLKDGDVFHEVN